MADKTIFSLGDKTFTAQELTVGQVEAWERSVFETENMTAPHLLDRMMNRSLPLSVVRLSVPGLCDDDLLAKPSELSAMYDAVEAANPFLVAMTERMAELGQQIFELGRVAKGDL